MSLVDSFLFLGKNEQKLILRENKTEEKNPSLGRGKVLL